MVETEIVHTEEFTPRNLFSIGWYVQIRPPLAVKKPMNQERLRYAGSVGEEMRWACCKFRHSEGFQTSPGIVPLHFNSHLPIICGTTIEHA